MLSATLASALGCGASVYSYNLGRFQFDASQSQSRIHQTQTMRISQWSLFREDVRDLFGLTSANMNTYMVVGTVLVSCAMNFIWNGYKDFPMDPPWLLLIWNNCVFACITFGLLSVWLAMHGSIASNSACVKILTQAIRPPVPTVVEVKEAMRQLENYEAAGMSSFLQPPAFLRPWSRSQEQDCPPAKSSSRGSPRSRSRSRQPSKVGQDAREWLEEVSPAGKDIGDLLGDANGGPGRSAVLYSHFWMLRRVQRGYACFDAYARISIAACAQQLLLICAYYALGHFMSKTEGWPSPTQNTAAAWLALVGAITASLTIFKLDLFIDRWRRLVVYAGLVLGPAVAGLATHLLTMRTQHGQGGIRPCDQAIPAFVPWGLAILACALHSAWLFVLLAIARPQLPAGLPLGFRSSIYLDVFGWHNSHFSNAADCELDVPNHWEQPKNVEKTMGRAETQCEEEQHHRLASFALREAKQLVRSLTALGSKPERLVHIRPEDQERLMKLQLVLECEALHLEDQLAQPQSERSSQQMSSAACWLRCECEVDTGHMISYWVDSRTAEVSWRHPGFAQTLDLIDIVNAVRGIQASQASSSQPSGTLPSIASEVSRQEGASDRLSALPRIGQDSESQSLRLKVATAETLPFELMPVQPDASENSSTLPWKCFSRSCLAQACLWTIAALMISLDPRYYESQLAPRETYDRSVLVRLNTTWPHSFFRPSAMSCSLGGRTLVLGDTYSIYLADATQVRTRTEGNLSSKAKSATVELEPFIATADLDIAWKSFGLQFSRCIVRRDCAAQALFLLSRAGDVIVERKLGAHRHDEPIHWTLSPLLDQNLEAIQVIQGTEADKCSSRASGLLRVGWAIYAATDAGQVVVLCPTAHRILQPLYVVKSLQRHKSAPSFLSVVDSHTGEVKVSHERIVGVHVDTENEVLWLQASSTKGHAEIRALSLYGAGTLGMWHLPSGRRWAPGVCSLGGQHGLLLAATSELNTAPGPELWHLTAEGAKGAWQRNSP